MGLYPEYTSLNMNGSDRLNDDEEEETAVMAGAAEDETIVDDEGAEVATAEAWVMWAS